MQPSNPLINFLRESLNRLKTKKPKYFIWWQYITGAMALITWLPTLLTNLGVTLPAAATSIMVKLVAACTTGVLFTSQLTTSSPVQAVTKDGAVLKQTDAQVLPFTAANEVKRAQDARVPNTSTTLAEVKAIK
jgi:hypothetical protein